MTQRKSIILFISIFVLACFTFENALGQKSKKKSKKKQAIETVEAVETPVAVQTPALSNNLDSISYALGVSIAQNISTQGLKEVNADKFANGVDEFLKGGITLISAEDANKILNEYFVAIQNKKNAKNVEMGKKFLAENATKEGVVSLPSGMQYKILKEGTGPKPTIEDKVTTHYHGTLIDGTVFDSSLERGEPATFPLNGVIKGWTEALLLMPVGSKWELYIPSDLAYGERGAGGSIGPNATLVFQVELLSIEGK